MPEHQTEFDVEAFWEGMSSLKNRVINIQRTHIDMSNLISVKYVGV